MTYNSQSIAEDLLSEAFHEAQILYDVAVIAFNTRNKVWEVIDRAEYESNNDLSPMASIFIRYSDNDEGFRIEANSAHNYERLFVSDEQATRAGI